MGGPYCGVTALIKRRVFLVEEDNTYLSFTGSLKDSNKRSWAVPGNFTATPAR